MGELASVQAIVMGRVQGVFFRDFTREHARALGLTGYVRNLPDGAVELTAEGERAALEQLLKELKRGPPRARVGELRATWGAHTGQHRDFNIRY